MDLAAGIHRISAPPFRDTGEIPPFRTWLPNGLRLVRTLPAQYTGKAGKQPDRDGALGFRQCSEPEREGIRAMGAKRGQPG